MRSAIVTIGNPDILGPTPESFETFIIPNLNHYGIQVTDYMSLSHRPDKEGEFIVALNTTDEESDLEESLNQALLDTAQQFETAGEHFRAHQITMKGISDYGVSASELQFDRIGGGEESPSEHHREYRGIFTIIGTYQDPKLASTMYGVQAAPLVAQAARSKVKAHTDEIQRLIEPLSKL